MHTRADTAAPARWSLAVAVHGAHVPSEAQQGLARRQVALLRSHLQPQVYAPSSKYAAR